MVDYAEKKMAETGVRLLWGTANLFSHPRYAAGASTNPDPAVFAYGAAQVKHALEATHRLGGANYVLWGGREGYETLLNTDLKREADQLASFLTMVAEHKHKIGFEGTLLIEPKPAEPTKHQYDYDCQSVHGFLERYDLVDEYRVNIEGNHATLAGHSFHHEVAYAVANGIFGSIDANRGDYQNGWDTDQFPNSVDELSLVLYEILPGRRLHDRRLQLRHEAPAAVDGPHRPVPRSHRWHRRSGQGAAGRGGAGRERNAVQAAGGAVCRMVGRPGKRIKSGSESLETLEARVMSGELNPVPVSGRQELLEDRVNRIIWTSGPDPMPDVATPRPHSDGNAHRRRDRTVFLAAATDLWSAPGESALPTRARAVRPTRRRRRDRAPRLRHLSVPRWSPLVGGPRGSCHHLRLRRPSLCRDHQRRRLSSSEAPVDAAGFIKELSVESRRGKSHRRSSPRQYRTPTGVGCRCGGSPSFG